MKLSASKMQWELQIVTSVSLLMLLQTPKVAGNSQESSYVIECIKDMIPHQVYNECCVRENNCTVSKQQNKAIDCMSRSIMSNYSWLFSDSREMGSATTEMSFSFTRNNQWFSDVLDTLGEICRRQSRGRLQTCIRNELIKRCRYSMLQDRFTSQPVRWWNQRRSDADNSGYGGNYGDNFDPRNRGQGQGYWGGRNSQDGYMSVGRVTDYGMNGDSRFNTRRRYGDDMEGEEIGYSDSESGRYK